MAKLELKKVLPYLAYGLESYNQYPNGEMFKKEVTLSNVMNFINGDVRGKIILRPLSDLTKEININNDIFIPCHRIAKYSMSHTKDYIDIRSNKYDWNTIISNIDCYWMLFEWHFDVFDLHSENLCIYYDELNK